jgi:hypothetical protein
MAARITPLQPQGNPADIQELLDFGTEGTGGASNVFLTLAKDAKAASTPLVVAALHPSAAEVFEISGFSKILMVRASEGEAREGL